ncbi:hypothetical protein RZS08_31155, partial [Arthrospira platensis SPKY1]|nr:hypothetical protein [Arthrospira platensis SPKY1]
ADFPWGWQEVGFDQTGWSTMCPVTEVLANPWGNRIGDHHIYPDPLPEMLEYEILPKSGVSGWPIRIPCNSQWQTLIDVGMLTNSYITLVVQGGARATVKMVTCEAPVEPHTGDKGNRNDVTGKELPGMVDLFEPG